MSQDYQSAPDPGDRLAVGVAGVRARLAELGASIGALRAEANRLRASAAARVTEVAVLEPEPDRSVIAAMARLVGASDSAVERDHDGAPETAASAATDRSSLEGLGEDGDAFDRFFSGDVEPEPSQRWLLGEATK